MLKLCGMQSTSLLPSLPSPRWHRMVLLDFMAITSSYTVIQCGTAQSAGAVEYTDCPSAEG